MKVTLADGLDIMNKVLKNPPAKPSDKPMNSMGIAMSNVLPTVWAGWLPRDEYEMCTERRGLSTSL